MLMNMKRFFAACTIVLSLNAQAQLKEGKIIYERTTQMQFRISGSPEAEAMAERMPRSRTDQFELMFGNNQSIYQFLPTATEEQQGGFGMMRIGGNNDIIYCNLENGTRVSYREFMEKEFLINDSLSKNNWKLTDETKKILGYTARKAITQRIAPSMRMSMENGEMKRTEVMDTVNVVAWFTTDIPVAIGPEFQGQLPGAILELEVNNGRVVHKAIEVSPKVNVAKIKAPTKGKAVTQKEFRDESAKILKEMQANMGGGNTIMIRQ